MDFPVRIEGCDRSGATFIAAGTLRNISARGALANINFGFQVGAKVKVDIAFPFARPVWLSYEGEVMRIEAAAGSAYVAVKFTNARPSFLEE